MKAIEISVETCSRTVRYFTDLSSFSLKHFQNCSESTVVTARKMRSIAFCGLERNDVS